MTKALLHATALGALGAVAVLAVSGRLPPPRVATPFGPAPMLALMGDSAQGPLSGGPEPWIEHVDTLRSGETLSDVLGRGGLGGSSLVRALRAARTLDERRAPAGLMVTVRKRIGQTPEEITFQLAPDRLLRVRRGADSGWVATEERIPWTTDTITVSGEIESTLYDAIDNGAIGLLPRLTRAELAWELADVYEYRLDMSRELHRGDSLRVLVERQRLPGGTSRLGGILAAHFSSLGTPIDAIRFSSGEGHAEYFDAAGRSLRAGFLRAPLAFRRISSKFGFRRHPILGIWRQHAGTDYVADAGTPVRSIGDGVVVIAGRSGGYGNLVEIRHRNGFISRYGHLRAFATGMRPGKAVAMGETIGYVGMTGLATAPHLHFEILVGGAQRDPAVALSRQEGRPVSDALRARFERERDALLSRLGLLRDTTSRQLAAR
ncbi:MAG TPA: M23 family metallopeptidase [Gemmatimonadaceae bacterium]|nr:M23 family metallopeptidase [Gemmatimonadaceae bacterium]